MNRRIGRYAAIAAAATVVGLGVVTQARAFVDTHKDPVRKGSTAGQVNAAAVGKTPSSGAKAAGSEPAPVTNQIVAGFSDDTTGALVRLSYSETSPDVDLAVVLPGRGVVWSATRLGPNRHSRDDHDDEGNERDSDGRGKPRPKHLISLDYNGAGMLDAKATVDGQTQDWQFSGTQTPVTLTTKGDFHTGSGSGYLELWLNGKHYRLISSKGGVRAGATAASKVAAEAIAKANWAGLYALLTPELAGSVTAADFAAGMAAADGMTGVAKVTVGQVVVGHTQSGTTFATAALKLTYKAGAPRTATLNLTLSAGAWRVTGIA